MTRRERVLTTLSFGTPDRLPKDLGGMRSTGISCFAYPNLVKALGLPCRAPMIHDAGQMLALPDTDVLDALDCDICEVTMDQDTNAFDDSASWKPYDFNSRLNARVKDPSAYSLSGTTIVLGREPHTLTMPEGAFVFDAAHGGQPLDLMAELPRIDLDAARRSRGHLLPDERIRSIAAYCRRARSSTDRAILFNGLSFGLGFPHGMAAWSMLCLTDPQYVKEYFDIVTERNVENAGRLLPEIAPYIDIIMLASDDQGTQNAPILPPAVYRDLYVPFYRRANETVHALAPAVNTFLHSCGAIYDILDDIISTGFDVINPVQWSAGGRSFREWKDKCRGRIALWGGGVNTQVTLPLGSVADVERESREAANYLSKDNGFVFCAIHNILAEIPPEKIIAMYRSASAN